jgi:hypothetical protein
VSNFSRISPGGLVLVLAAVGVLGAPAVARADAVTDWNKAAATAAITIANRPGPPAMIRLAMVHGAIYDAVNSIDRGHAPYLVLAPAQPWDSEDAAAATAAYRVLVNILPAQASSFEALYAASLAGVPDGPAKDGGIAAGEAAAAAMLAARVNDGLFGPFQFTAGTTPGAWRPTPPAFAFDPGASVGFVKPFLIESPSQFRSDGPNALTSDAYATDFAEVKELGSRTSATRTAEQTDIAFFWAEPSAVFWSGVLPSISAARQLTLAENARYFAMLYTAGADGGISCWNDKATWSSWRPITAIRMADSDANPATVADPSWEPLLVTPPFPEHPSGHACMTSAIVHTLQTYFGTDKIAFSRTSSTSHTTRSFDRFSDALKELIDARVYSGIHFRTADIQGAVIGRKVAHWLEKYYFHPV